MALRIVHCIHHPVGAKAFIDPVVAFLNAEGFDCELWVDHYPQLQSFYARLSPNHRVVPCDFSRHYRRMGSAVTALRRELRRFGANILHAHQTRASLIPLLAARLEGIPVRIYHNHGLTYPAFHGARRLFFIWFQRLLAALATHLLFVSESTLAQAREDRIIRRKSAAVPGPGSISGIDLLEYELGRFNGAARCAARNRWALEADHFVVGYVGRPMLSKGFPQMLAAWRQFISQGGFGRLLVAGCSPPDVTHFGYSGSEDIICLGYIDEMKEFYAACDVIALPSLSEGFPYTLLEGAAAGRALLGTNVPGIRDAIQNGATGLLVETGDTNGMADALMRLSRDPALRLSMGLAARARVEERFSRESVLRELLAYYHRELAGMFQKQGTNVLV